MPAASDETAALLAVPPESVAAAPKLTPFVLNCTVPLGVPAPGATAVTVAVKVTACPTNEGFVEELTAVELLALFTVWPPESVPVLALKLPSPL